MYKAFINTSSKYQALPPQVVAIILSEMKKPSQTGCFQRTMTSTKQASMISPSMTLRSEKEMRPSAMSNFQGLLNLHLIFFLI